MAFSIGVVAPLLASGPSRPASKGCQWEKVSDATVGLEAWVETCEYGTRKIDHTLQGHSLSEHYSDGGVPYAVVDVLDLGVGETPDAGMKRLFAERTSKAVAGRCRLAEYRGDKPPSGVKRYTFVPDPAYQKELDAKRDPNEVPDPPCGDWGFAPDGIQYFEVHQGPARRILFVRVGQDVPLFDEKTLRILQAP
jgi:hypothetical protein